jgi:uncharacterized membrane protein
VNPGPPERAQSVRARRRKYIDWARAIAVLVMIEAHLFDAWVRPSERTNWVFRDLMVLGGLAAPMFLWLAGLATVLYAERLALSVGRRAAGSAAIRRGLEIFILAFLFRLQAFIVTPGSHPLTLFRVDILNVMGPALVATGLVWMCVSNRTALTMVYSTLAAAAAIATPLFRTADWVESLPRVAEWYVRPAGEFTTFTLFPWCGFVLAGGAVGALLAVLKDTRNERRIHLALAAVGLFLVELGFITSSRPALFEGSSFWTSSPTYFAIRVGVLMVTLSAIYAAETLLSRWDIGLSALQRVGASSLFVYWIHVELVYGYASGPLHGNLTLLQTAAAYLAFCGLIYGAIILRDRVVEAWRRWPAQRPTLGRTT